ncbi:DNA-binding protein H-NS [Paraburkholderia sp. GAS448]|uniref:H-NS family nucleoid-associated regulatory protein n=1 Tax=Paraburkholderia sp. GAS448 TaxID=3035136 RepID=UPI003D1AD867
MATLEQIRAKMKQLQVQADALISKKAHAAINQIRALMLKHGLTTDDIEAHTGAATGGTKRGPEPGAKRTGKSAVTAVKKPATSVKGKLPPKYINPKTGETWSGHARPPAWIANVKDRTKFLIASGANAVPAASAGAVSKSKSATRKASAAAGTTAHKGQQKGPQPAKYRDPKSGATWSGRGRAPAWLAGSRDLSKFLIDGASTVAGTGAASKPKAVAKKPAKKTPVAKKAAVKKSVVAKRVVSKPGVAEAPEAAAAQATV